jgi:zinc transport system substrate-binding protein
MEIFMSEKKRCIMTLIMLVLALFFGLVAVVQAQTIVASTSLTAAIARAAGATEVRVITPPDVKHPPEYELRPSDIAKFDGATAVVFAGYERMVKKLAETLKGRNILMIQIDTTTTPDNLIVQAKKIAAAIHTEKLELAWEKAFNEKLVALRPRLAPFAGKKAVVHLHAQGFARWAGLSVVQVIMPGEQSVKAVAEAVAKQPEIVADILHMPAARMIADNAGCRYTQLINFPGVDKTVTIEDVFEFNTEQIVKAFR